MKVFYLRADLCLKNKKQFLQKRIVYLLVFTVLSGVSASVLAQPSSAIRLNGTVLSAETGQPLQSASIKVTGRGGVLPKTSDTQTDTEGKFALYTSLKEGIIEVSYIGYLTQAITFNPTATSPFAINLEPDQNALREVEINAGYYTVKERERTGSIARVDAKTIDKQPVLNVMETLKGRMAGVQVTQAIGEIGGGFSIRIRGENSLRSDGNEPLYLVDGVPYPSGNLRGFTSGGTSSPLNVLNPGDIEAVTVLKDADATAIYGSRGSNGVVLITTRLGKTGEPRFTVDVGTGTADIRKFVNVLNTEQYLEMRTEAYANNPAYAATAGNAPDLLIYDQQRYTDWQQVLIGNNAHRFDSKVSLAGGTPGLNFMMSGNYLNQGNIYPGDFGYQRGGGHLSLQQGGNTSRFRSQVSVTYTLDRNNLPETSASMVNSALTLAPNAPDLLSAEGTINFGDGSFTNNPMIALKQPYVNRNRNTAVQSMVAYYFTPDIHLKANIGYHLLQVGEEKLSPASTFYNPTPNRVNKVNTTNTTWNAEPVLSFDRRFGKNQLQVIAGGTVQLIDTEGEGLQGSGFMDEQLMNNIALAETVTASLTNYSQYRYLAGFTRLSYSYGGKYFVKLTGRRDGSSRFGADKQWGNFGAIGSAWIVTEEKIIKDRLPWLSFGKIRASYGVTGSDQIPNYGFLSAYQVWSAASLSSGVFPMILNPLQLANADFHWESTRKLELSLDIGILHDRIRATIARYRNRSGNQLVGYPLPAISGFTSVQANMPAVVQNSGWELEVHTINLKGRSYRWSSSLNLTLPSRQLLRYPGIAASSYANTYQVGESMYRNRRYVVDGVDTETGIYRIRDVDGSGSVGSGDMVWRDQPRILYGGVDNTLAWKGIELSFFFQADKRERTYVRSFARPGAIGNQPVEVMERWKQPGEVAAVQKFWPNASGDPNTRYSNVSNSGTAWLEDTFFLRLSNVSLSWDCPESWAGKAGFTGIRLSVLGQNLWVLDSKNRFDPEVSSAFVLPPLRSIYARIQLTL